MRRFARGMVWCMLGAAREGVIMTIYMRCLLLSCGEHCSLGRSFEMGDQVEYWRDDEHAVDQDGNCSCGLEHDPEVIERAFYDGIMVEMMLHDDRLAKEEQGAKG
jgi:hypothetical protein